MDTKPSLIQQILRFGIVGGLSFVIDFAVYSAVLLIFGKGKVTVPKNCKAGTYTITVRAAGNNNYRSASKAVTINVK